MAENLRALGRIGEEAAARYLVNAGYAMVGRNVYIGKLEADILCVSPDGLYPVSYTHLTLPTKAEV